MKNKTQSNIEKLLKAGEEAAEEKKFAEALSTYLRLLNLFPGIADSFPENEKREKLNDLLSRIYAGLGRMLHKTGKHEEALSLYEKAEKHANAPDVMGQIYHAMSSVFISLGDCENATEVFKDSKLYDTEMLPRELELFKGKHMGLPVDKCLAEAEDVKKKFGA